MSLFGQTVRIIVHKPENWDKGNLFGTIISDRGGKKLILRLTKQIIGKKITSDIIELQPMIDKETFKPLGQYYSVMISGSLISNNSDSIEPIIYGSITLD